MRVGVNAVAAAPKARAYRLKASNAAPSSTEWDALDLAGPEASADLARPAGVEPRRHYRGTHYDRCGALTGIGRARTHERLALSVGVRP
jgi:hypothetical protein